MKVESAMHRGVEWRSPETPVMELAHAMRTHDIGAIPIAQDDRLIGMVTDRDIVCRGLADGRTVDGLTARDVMTKGIVWCRSDDEIEDAVRIMEARRIRRLPVIDSEKRLVGMLSLGDVSSAAGQSLCGELAKAVAAHH